MDNPNVIIYCGGKCGSMTLLRTLSINYKVIHTHGINTTLSFLKDNKLNINKYNYPNQLFDKFGKNPIYIIDSYRNPIERTISSFFHNINKHVPNYKSRTIKQLIDIFNTSFLHIEEYHPINQVLTHFNLELFKSFDFEKRYNLIKHNNLNIIKIRFKDINCWDSILTNIFGKNIKITPYNLTKNKNIYGLYKLFLNKYKLPDNYFLEDEFKIYNSIEEQLEYKKLWNIKS